MRKTIALTLGTSLLLSAGAALAQGDPVPPPADPKYEQPDATPVPPPKDSKYNPVPSTPPPPPSSGPAEVGGKSAGDENADAGTTRRRRKLKKKKKAKSGRRYHDGFFFRGGLGVGSVGYAWETRTIDLAGNVIDVDATARAGASRFDLMFGGTPATGLVLGGEFRSWYAPSADIEVEGPNFSGTFETENGIFTSSLSFFALYYPDPASGLHFGGSFGLASISVEDERPDDETPRGIIFGGLIGYDWWVSDYWSLGIMGRIDLGGFQAEYDSPLLGQVEENYGFFSPSVSFTFTYH